MTHINFERTGGLMGRKIALELDLDKLPQEQAGKLKGLLEQASFFDLPANLIEHPVPDEFIYTVTVSRGFLRKHSVVVSDSSAPDNLRPLLDELFQLARGKR